LVTLFGVPVAHDPAGKMRDMQRANAFERDFAVFKQTFAHNPHERLYQFYRYFFGRDSRMVGQHFFGHYFFGFRCHKKIKNRGRKPPVRYFRAFAIFRMSCRSNTTVPVLSNA